MGGRGASSGGFSMTSVNNRIGILKVDLDYAEQKYKAAAKRLNYTNSTEARNNFDAWDAERKLLRKEYSGAIAQKDMIDRIKSNAQKGDTIKNLKFRKGKDNSVKFTYTNGVTGEKNNRGTIDKNGKVTYEKRK